MTSSMNSAVTRSDPAGFMDQDEISSMELCAKELVSPEWTDEKHSMYLSSMETTFVDQLYNSMYLSGWRTQKKHHSHKREQTRAADQFKVYKDGCWQRIKFAKGEPPPREAEEHGCLGKNPWIQHFRAGVRQDQTIQGNSSFGSQNVGCGGKMLLTTGLANTSDCSLAYQGHHQHSSLTEEFSDQNFSEESNEEEEMGNLHAMKRMKTVK